MNSFRVYCVFYKFLFAVTNSLPRQRELSHNKTPIPDFDYIYRNNFNLSVRLLYQNEVFSVQSSFHLAIVFLGLQRPGIKPIYFLWIIYTTHLNVISHTKHTKSYLNKKKKQCEKVVIKIEVDTTNGSKKPIEVVKMYIKH